MGVRVDKYLGYVVNIQDEWNKLTEEERDLWLDTKHTDTFKAYYLSGDCKDKITVIYDGMSGQYTKLVYVVEYFSATCDDDEKIVGVVNKYLGSAEVPNEIRQKLREVYKEIFSLDYVTDFKVQLQYFIHWS